MLKELRVAVRTARPIGLRRRPKPGLAAVREKIAGGLRLPRDETGDCHLFTQRLAANGRADRRDVSLRHTVEGLERTGDGTRTQFRTSTGPRCESRRRLVLALGSFTTRLARPLGIRLPVYPVKGYSITLPIVDPATVAGLHRDG